MTSLLTEGGGLTAADASGASAVAWLLIALPLLGAALLLLGGRRTDRFGPLLATGLSWGSFVVGLVILVQLMGLASDERAQHLTLWNWIPAGAFQLDVGLLVDPLSMSFVMLITFVGSLIHVYSIGYMAHDPDKRRFFAYLNFFVASMLLLVLADSYLLLFVGWEGVGLASYLLIGFWNWNPAYATAANKAFFVNRVGDLGLIDRDHASCSRPSGASTSRRCSRVRRRRARPRSPPWGSSSSSAPAASPRSSRSSPGSGTPWPVRHPCPRSSTRRRWSRPASTSSCARARSTTGRPTPGSPSRSWVRSR